MKKTDILLKKLFWNALLLFCLGVLMYIVARFSDDIGSVGIATLAFVLQSLFVYKHFVNLRKYILTLEEKNQELSAAD